MSDSAKITLEHETRDRGFTHVRNELIEDRELSWKALGLLLYLLRQPPWWQFSLCHIAKQKKDRIDSTRAGVQELEAAGYLVRHPRVRLENGRYGNARWVVRNFRPETTSSEPGKAVSATSLGNPTRGKPTQEKPRLAKPTLTSTKPKQVLTTATTTTANSDRNDPLVAPRRLSASDGQAAVQFVIERLGSSDLAQKVLDELDGKIAQQRIRGDWQSYLHGLVKRAQDGEFVPAAGRQVAKGRQPVVQEWKQQLAVRKADPVRTQQHFADIKRILK